MFVQAVSMAVPNASKITFQSEKCLDQYVGTLESNFGRNRDFSLRISADSAPVINQRVILILESPHLNEFKAPIGPAKGTTGRLIRCHLREVLTGLADNTASLFLVNAVQYQCSLGYSPNEFRDAVFCKAWELFGQVDFARRLQELVNGQTALVVNACTKGNSRGLEVPLRAMVERTIAAAIGRQSDIRISHPSSWASANNRNATWALPIL